MRWVLLLVRLPAGPSRHRVAVWRELSRVGALSRGQGVWAVPDVPVFAEGVERALRLTERAAGEAVVLEVIGRSDAEAARFQALFTTARQAKLIGDLTLEGVLASKPLRDRYRAALGTGARKLLVLVSTWGPESLIRQHPGLPSLLAAQLPHDEHQLALVAHPNERGPRGRSARARLRRRLPVRPAQAGGGHRRAAARGGRGGSGARAVQPRLAQPYLAGRQGP
ncbi:hypothetical protein GCM10022403_079900 [Streptomyces coacervatus]|uniref:ChrB N-terminal domain-containing protein n=1 Tax=Streptomyces coacervatus TaxID=647381 RepID=A0ABP7J584_9ACTN